jgi:hypothetical protein
MQSTAPVGGIVAGVLVSGAGIEAAIVAATVVTTVPGLLGLVVPALSLAGGGGGGGPAQEALEAAEALQRM